MGGANEWRMSFDEAKQAGLQRATIPRLHDGGARSLLALTDPSSTLLYRSSTLWVIRASMVGGDGSVLGKDNRTSQARFPLLNLAGAPAQTQTKSIRRDPAAAPADRERDASDRRYGIVVLSSRCPGVCIRVPIPRGLPAHV